jgi:O-antigen ligase
VGIYLALTAAIVSLVVVHPKANRTALADRGVICVLAAFAIFSLAFVLGAKKPDDGMAFVDFLALPVIVPAYALLLGRTPSRNMISVALLATLGCTVALAVGFRDVELLRMSRAAGGTSPIFFSDMAVLLGYFALLGMLVWKSTWRWIFGIGNAFAVGAALYGGTRGAIVAEITMLVVVIVFILVWWDRRWTTRATTAAGIVAIASMFSFALFDLSRTASIFVTANEVVETATGAKGDEVLAKGTVAGQEITGDASTNIRLKFWTAGLQAFLQSPIYGHSWWNRFEAAIPFMPADIESAISHDKTAHLHNDLISFAAGGGLMGVFAYLLLMAAPAVSVWFSPRRKPSDCDHRNRRSLA